MKQDGRSVLVTGASRGIGRAISEALLAQGVRVIAIGRDFSHWDPCPENLQAIALDLSRLEQLPEQLTALAKRFPDISGLICCAGFGRFGSLEEFSYAQIQEMIAVNLTQHIYLTKTFLPTLKRHRQGDLILIGSEAALAGGAKGAVYSATKFALRGFAQALRKECASRNIRVCLINPGMVAGSFFDRLDFQPGPGDENAIRPKDVADAVMLALNAPRGTVFDEINLSPLKRVIQFGKPST